VINARNLWINVRHIKEITCQLQRNQLQGRLTTGEGSLLYHRAREHAPQLQQASKLIAYQAQCKYGAIPILCRPEYT
jgi:hypothetical protein